LDRVKFVLFTSKSMLLLFSLSSFTVQNVGRWKWR
jgi:hypothetical protein